MVVDLEFSNSFPISFGEGRVGVQAVLNLLENRLSEAALPDSGGRW